MTGKRGKHDKAKTEKKTESMKSEIKDANDISPVEEKKGFRLLSGMPAFLLALVCVMIMGYIVACSSVRKDIMLSTTEVNGVDISGMTVDEAKSAVKTAYEKEFKEKKLSVKAANQDFQIAIYDALSFDLDGVVAKAFSFGHGSFFSRGWDLLEAVLLGQKITEKPSVGDEAVLSKAIQDAGVLDLVTTVQTSYERSENTLIFTKGVTGGKVKADALNKAIHSAIEEGDYDSVIEAEMETVAVEATDMQAIHKKMYATVREATLDPEKDYKIVKSVEGIDFDAVSAQEAFDHAEEGAKVEVPLDVEKPKITTKKMKKYLFRDELGKCFTYVSGTNARISNVNLAAKTINGTILLPGESFSYNNKLGKRTEEKGYKKAPAYSDGKSVQELGGGICQVSSTLYKAIVRANLEITEHHNHTYLSSYIEAGMDATVSWDGPDLRFKNNQDYPIKIVAEYSDNSGTITVRILGSNLDGHWVDFTNETISTSSCKVVYEDDPTIEKGKEIVQSAGQDGRTVQTYRIVYDKNDKVISSEKEDRCTYRSHDRVILRGTKQPATTEKKEETQSQQVETVQQQDTNGVQE